MKFYNLNRLRRNLGANFALPRLRSPEMSTLKGIEPRMIAEMFTRHPASVGETYGEHMLVASSFGLKLLLAALACFVHALLPFLFERTGSTAVQFLHGRMVVNRMRHADRVRDGVPAC
jgi:hypothetical protein